MTDDGLAHERLGVRDYLEVLRRRVVLVVVVTLLVAGVAIGTSLVETPVYSSTALLTIEPSNTSGGNGFDEPFLTEQELDTQVQVMASEAVADRAAETLGLGLSGAALLGKVFPGTVGETRVMRVSATDVDPDRAADIANAFADAYLVHRRENALGRVLQAASSLRARTETVQSRVEEIEDQLRTASGEASVQLERERDRLEEQLAELSVQVSVLDATDAFVRGGGEVIREASPSGSPLSPQPVRDGILGVAAGLLLGVALAFARDWFDDAIRSEGQVARSVRSGSVLAYVPFFALQKRSRRWRRDDLADAPPPLELLAHPDSVGSEAIRTLRTNLRFAAGRSALRSLLVTSPGEAEGKSTIAANLAVAAAAGGTRVLLIEGDLRRPQVHRMFGLPNGRGTSTLLTGEDRLSDVVVDVGVPGLGVVTAGRRPPNPAELLGTGGLGELLLEAADAVDLVIIDGPPVLAVADSLEIAREAEATMMVVAYGQTGRRLLREADRRLRGVDAALAGVVMNLAPAEVGYYYGYRSVEEQEPSPEEPLATDDGSVEPTTSVSGARAPR